MFCIANDQFIPKAEISHVMFSRIQCNKIIMKVNITKKKNEV